MGGWIKENSGLKFYDPYIQSVHFQKFCRVKPVHLQNHSSTTRYVINLVIAGNHHHILSSAMAPKIKADTDDVLDFINSLPDSKSGSPRPPQEKTENKEELFEFLDELTTNKSKSKFEPSKTKTEKQVEPEKKQEKEKVEEEEIKSANEELEINPIGSITNWWQNEGSSKVSSLWGTITSNAQSLGETTYQIASSTSNQLSQQRQNFLQENFTGKFIDNDQILSISNRLNGVLISMSQQIKEGLIDDDDELLNILLIYDFHNFNHLDKLCSDKFNKVMNQVEGGIRVSVNNFNEKAKEQDRAFINFNLFQGKIIDGEKLCFANLDGSIKDYTHFLKLEEQSKKIEGEEEGEGHDLKQINKSNIFVSIQAINKDGQDGNKDAIYIEANNSESFHFLLILKDITNDITIITKTQSFPLKWSKWLNGEFEDVEKQFSADIQPNEWVQDWIKDGLSLSFAVLAQEYVIKRMGI